MYKFVVLESGCCSSGYSIGKAEQTSNKMVQDGYKLIQVYQTTTPGCGTSQSALVMVFQRIKQ
jgi:hypothetical protein